jgi:hypothetical protein
MTRTPGADDPAGGTKAARFQSNGSDFSHFYPVANIVPATGSTWARGEGAAEAFPRFVPFATRMSSIAVLEGNDWSRLSWTTESTALERMWFYAGEVPGYPAVGVQTSFIAFGAQFEAPARYPSSYIVSGTTAVTRLAESLSINAHQVFPQGWFDVTLVIAPHYATGEALSEHDLLFFDSDNRVLMRPDGVIVLRIAGNELASTPLTWSREIPLTIVVRNKQDLQFLSVTGAAPPFETSGAAGQAVSPLPERAFILGGPQGAQEGADLRAIEVLP